MILSMQVWHCLRKVTNYILRKLKPVFIKIFLPTSKISLFSKSFSNIISIGSFKDLKSSAQSQFSSCSNLYLTHCTSLNFITVCFIGNHKKDRNSSQWPCPLDLNFNVTKGKKGLAPVECMYYLPVSVQTNW